MTIAERIKTARKEAGITQEELASKMYVTNNCISMWERGLRKPKYETLARIADAIGINVNRLLQTPMNNADRIRAMSDEELAKFLTETMCEWTHKTATERKLIEHTWFKKLRQPAKEDA